MNFDVAEWGPPLAVMLGGILIGALFLRGRGNAEAAVTDEGRRSDLEANRQAAIDALRQLDLDRDKLEPDVYRREREALIARGAAAMRTLETAEPATDLVARLHADRARVGDVAFLDAVRQVAPEVAARGAAPPGIAPEWKGAGWATLFCALLAVLTWMATSESVDRREGASMTGNQDLGGPPGGPPQEWLQAKAAEEAKLVANPNDLDAKNNLTQLHLSAGDATKAMEMNRQVLESDPENADGRVFKAVLAATVGMYDKALVELDAVLAAAPGHVKAQTYRALILLETGKTAEAITALEAALVAQPGNPTLTRALGRARGAGATAAGAPPPPTGPVEILAAGTATVSPGKESALEGAKFVYVSLKDPGGGPPLGALKLPPGPFPLAFEITTANLISMGGPGRRVPPKINLAMWVDRDGNPMTRELPIGTIDGLDKGATGLTLELE